MEAFKHWRAYLEGAEEIIIYTDHKNLEYFTTSKVQQAGSMGRTPGSFRQIHHHLSTWSQNGQTRCLDEKSRPSRGAGMLYL